LWVRAKIKYCSAFLGKMRSHWWINACQLTQTILRFQISQLVMHFEFYLYYSINQSFVMVQEPEELFETISQALLASVDRDCLSGWGGHVYLV